MMDIYSMPYLCDIHSMSHRWDIHSTRKKGRMTEQQVATRDWHTHAIVRIITDTTRSNALHRTHTFHAGKEIEMVQWGRAGRPVVRDSWWTSFDIDEAYIINAEKVEVIQVIDEMAP